MITPTTDLAARTAVDADWAAIRLLSDTVFGEISHPDTIAAWRAMVPDDGALVVCDGADVVGQSVYLDLALTVPGGAVIPAAGVSFVGVAPTHRRRGILRTLYTELHERIAGAGYPVAALTASEGGIYGRFGYGPATAKQLISIDRRFAEFHASAPDSGGVRLARPAEHPTAFVEIYERWRRRTPGGLRRPQAVWDELLADRPDTRDGGSELFALLHPDGYVLYRINGSAPMNIHVWEFTAVTGDAQVALWRALLGMDLMEKVNIWTSPANVVPQLLTNPRLVGVTASSDSLWIRIMDVAAALTARRYQADLDVVLQVNDGFRSDGGQFDLRIRDGRATCTPTERPADVRLDLDVLGGLYLGGAHIAGYAAANRLSCNDPALVHRIGAAFASDIPAQLGFGF
ncbi:enhanced intracellular survival protein Eis [Mycobacterium sp. NPDC003449]